ncbi:MAG: FtsH protease activity modulator HflK, partial [Gemmataceae bacterium]
LLVACPCALILATPTAMVAAIGGLARRGILVRGGTVLQRAAKIDAVVFDKTGTLTEGRFEIVRVVAIGRPENEVLALAAAAERGSDHVLARVITDEARTRRLNVPAVDDARVLPGRGAECRYQGRALRAGSAAFLSDQGVRNTSSVVEEADRLGATAVLIAEDDTLLGGILLRDRIREGSREAIAGLKELGVDHVVMLTGDRKRAADAIAREVGVPHVEADLLPEHKLDRIRGLAAQGRHVAMAGDGINDAPALAAAHVGIAVHGASDITAEAADVVYMGQSLDKLPKLFEVARAAMTTAWQNIVFFAGIVNTAAVLACAFGILGPLGAAFTHQISSFCVMMNSLRLLRVESAGPSRFSRWLRWPRFTSIPFDRIWQWRRPLAYALGALWILNGFYIVSADQVGVIERFGKKITPWSEPGLHYKLPWPIEKLTRLEARRVRSLEIGYRSAGGTTETEPAAYEWSAQHRAGRFQRKPEESMVLTGDQNMIEVTASVHYRLSRPDDYLFSLADGETTVRVAGESALHSVVTTTALDDALTQGRRSMEERVRKEMQERLDRYSSGVEVAQVKLLDVHPSVEVVDAFRGVSGAYEEKNRLINEAEGYRNEQVALARGRGQADLLNARGYSLGRRNRAEGDASRFTQAETAFRASPGTTETRLYLEAMEQVLPGKRKMIVDSNKGRRHLLLLEDGVEIGSPGAAPLLPQARPPREEE